jgi:hypothetical protein
MSEDAHCLNSTLIVVDTDASGGKTCRIGPQIVPDNLTVPLFRQPIVGYYWQSHTSYCNDMPSMRPDQRYVIDTP